MTTKVTSSRWWRTLESLAGRPFDLTLEGALSDGGRIGAMTCSAAGLRLLYGTQRIDDQVMAALQGLADEQCLAQRFNLMRQGAVINRIEGWPSENRQVLHTSSRDLFSDNPKEPLSTGQARAEHEKLHAFLCDLEQERLRGSTGKVFDTLVNIGIGGSDLGPRAVYEALKAFRQNGRQVRFIANVDPDDAAVVFGDCDLEKTLVCVVSKSGSTLETLTNEELARRAFTEQGLDPDRHFLAVTGAGSPMDNPARYLRSFHMFDYIGGRYSATSMVGCVLLGFALGYDQLRQFLRGAYEMDEVAGNPDIRQNMPLLLALIGVWNRNFLGYPTVAILPYSQALHRFPAHLQQCDMESNGKSILTDGAPVLTGTGPVVWGEPGTNGQHAFYQLLHQGTEIVPSEFIGFLKCQHDRDIVVKGTTSQQKLVANMLAQSLALAAGQDNENPNRRFAGNRPNSVIIGKRLDPSTMGRILSLYEAKIVFQGFTWQINSFDQEGVQLGKVLAGRFLRLMESGERQGFSVEEQLLGELEK